MIKWCTMGFKKLYSRPKKLYQFISNLCFQGSYQLLANYFTTYRRISHPVAFVVSRLALGRDIYPCILHLHRSVRQQNMEKEVCSKLHLQVEQGYFCFSMFFFFFFFFFQFQNKAALIV